MQIPILRSSPGFRLVELLVVIVIIAALAALSMMGFTRIRAASDRAAAFITATDWIVSYNSRFLWLQNPVEGKSTDQRIAYRHGNKAVVVYYDGSSGFVSPDDIRAFDQRGGANHPFRKAHH